MAEMTDIWHMLRAMYGGVEPPALAVVPALPPAGIILLTVGLNALRHKMAAGAATGLATRSSTNSLPA